MPACRPRIWSSSRSRSRRGAARGRDTGCSRACSPTPTGLGPVGVSLRHAARLGMGAGEPGRGRAHRAGVRSLETSRRSPRSGACTRSTGSPTATGRLDPAAFDRPSSCCSPPAPTAPSPPTRGRLVPQGGRRGGPRDRRPNRPCPRPQLQAGAGRLLRPAVAENRPRPWSRPPSAITPDLPPSRSPRRPRRAVAEPPQWAFALQLPPAQAASPPPGRPR